MEFKSLKNIESSFKQIRMVALVFLLLCAVVAGYSIWSSYSFAERQREKIYVLDNGKSLMLALSQDLSQNRPVEAKEHVKRFHELFFTLSRTKKRLKAISNGHCSFVIKALSGIIRIGARKGIIIESFPPISTKRYRWIAWCVILTAIHIR